MKVAVTKSLDSDRPILTMQAQTMDDLYRLSNLMRNPLVANYCGFSIDPATNNVIIMEFAIVPIRETEDVKPCQ